MRPTTAVLKQDVNKVKELEEQIKMERKDKKKMSDEIEGLKRDM
jgi:hypothetical protein